MNEITLERTATPLETVGLVCARASFVAVLVGVVEGITVSRLTGVSVAGIGLATAGLWFPAAVIALLPATRLHRFSKRKVATALLVAVLTTLLFAKFATTVSPVLRALPVEASVALAFAWLAAGLQLDDPLRRPLAIIGIVVAVVLQIFSTRWVDAHRAFAGLLIEHTAVPRLMLRTVLRRFV
ncbi:MAG: hypothetical protein HYV09_36700 [Deltaproteobacteria bacterium]|nr:hypothetical protein [Deltaproteobacteria bacterium]